MFCYFLLLARLPWLHVRTGFTRICFLPESDMGRKRKLRAPVRISRSPKQVKRENESSVDPLDLEVQQVQPMVVEERPEGSENQHLPDVKPWAEKCQKWIVEQSSVSSELPEPEVDEAEDETLMEHRQPLDEAAQLPADTETPLRHRLKHFSEKQILNSVMYDCEWMKCGFETIEDLEYVVHVEDHCYQYLSAKKGANDFSCYWDLCTFQTTVASDLESHVHFHAYHNRIKTYGASLGSIIRIPKCNSDSRRRNCIDSFRTTFSCEWADCEEVYRKAQEFFVHVNNHVQDQFPVDKKSSKTDIMCLWVNCKQNYKRCSIALEHVRKHSTEKTIGCYNCGAMFVSRLKYIDHCKRQVEYHNREYPCPECGKLFATKQLVVDHSNIHNKKYDCSLCPMKFPSKKALAYHIRYRHVNIKPYQCHLCSRRTVTKADLDEHVLTHDDRRMFRCEEFGCAAAYKCQKSLKKHVDSIHYGTETGIYACHRCPNQYKAGANLSKHLMKAHNYERPLGYNRFTYRSDRDGIYRLATFLSGEDKVTSDHNEQSLNDALEDPRVQSLNDALEETRRAIGSSGKQILVGDKTDDEGSEPEALATISIEKFEPVSRGMFAIELKASANANTAPKPKPSTTSVSPSMKSAIKIEQDDPSTSLTMAKSIDDFSVMKRYLKVEKHVVISFEETDSAGSVIRSETVQTTELSPDNLLQKEL